MSNQPTSFADWQVYPSKLDPIHVAWLRNAKKSKTAFAVADIEGVEISHKKFLRVSFYFQKKLMLTVQSKTLGFCCQAVEVERLHQLQYFLLERRLSI